jgi:alkyl sulfatase BDS1-like metallo-beta-lactamase superfamily hydrolase
MQADAADLTVTIDRADLEPIMMQRATFASQAAAGKAKLVGNAQVLAQLAGCLVPFDPAFEILPGTKRPVAP